MRVFSFLVVVDLSEALRQFVSFHHVRQIVYLSCLEMFFTGICCMLLYKIIMVNIWHHTK